MVKLSATKRVWCLRFAQKHGIDYEEIFAPLANFTSIRILLSLVHFEDVETAFLHKFLHEDIYMVQPVGYIDNSSPNLICKLMRSLYGLNQSPRMYNKTIDGFMLRLNLNKCVPDHCIYTRRADQNMGVVALYVDI